MTTQPQLLQMALAPQDVVYTPSRIASAIVRYFSPKGRVLDPCRGDGSFYNSFPSGAERIYCEITEGKDFFCFTEKVDWIIGNPPYSIFFDFLQHSFSLAHDIVYLVPTNKIFQSQKLMKSIKRFGGIRSMLVYGSGHLIGFPFGFSVGAFHFQKDYKGEVDLQFAEAQP